MKSDAARMTCADIGIRRPVADKHEASCKAREKERFGEQKDPRKNGPLRRSLHEDPCGSIFALTTSDRSNPSLYIGPFKM